jgi:POT family proton-dependent oligopeptide transporter
LTDGTRCMNIGAQSRIVATFIEKYVGFWASFLMSLCSITLSLVVFVLSRKGLGKLGLPVISLNCPWLRYLHALVSSDPGGTVLAPAFKALYIAAQHGFKMDATRPAVVSQRTGKAVSWSDEFVDELKHTLFACRAL